MAVWPLGGPFHDTAAWSLCSVTTRVYLHFSWMVVKPKAFLDTMSFSKLPLWKTDKFFVFLLAVSSYYESTLGYLTSASCMSVCFRYEHNPACTICHYTMETNLLLFGKYTISISPWVKCQCHFWAWPFPTRWLWLHFIVRVWAWTRRRSRPQFGLWLWPITNVNMPILLQL